jgi:preprotein translocase SecE subunit
VTYRKDQGRYARMLAFWALTCLFAYGCFHGGGLVTVLDRWMEGSNPVLIEPFPLVQKLRVSTLVAIGVVLAIAFAIHVTLSRPKIADALIETEAEMQKVTWPTWSEAWSGTMAVTGMVIVLLVFLTGVDLILLKGIMMLIGGSS